VSRINIELRRSEGDSSTDIPVVFTMLQCVPVGRGVVVCAHVAQKGERAW